MSASLEELHKAVGESLKSHGVSNEIKARLRAEIFKILEGDGTVVVPPCPSNENLIINELIREYLEFNNYKHTLSVFTPESGQPKEAVLPRSILAQDLNIHARYSFEEERPIPLLYSVIAAMQQPKKTS